MQFPLNIRRAFGDWEVPVKLDGDLPPVMRALPPFCAMAGLRFEAQLVICATIVAT
jgi:hypothetical protein